MKKHFTTILLSVACITTQAQIELGARGGASTFWLLNSSTSTAAPSQNLTLSLSYNFGLHLAYDFTDQVGLETNFLYASLSQTYSGSFSKTGLLPDGNPYVNGQSYTSKNLLTAYQIPFLGCFETPSGSFVEVGIEYDMIQSANYSGSFSSPSYNPSFNAANNFAKSNILGVFGFGGKYSLNDYVFLITDFRVTYGFTDLQGVDGVGQAYSSSYYTSIKPTNTLTGSFNIGIFYLIPVVPTYQVGHKCKGSPKVRSGNRHPK